METHETFKKNKKLKYSVYKIFNFKEKIDSLPLDNPEILPPIHIRIKPTNKCNHNCWYCAYRASNLQLGKDMRLKDEIPKEKMLEIIDDCIDMGVKAITFSGGGEPLIYPYIVDVLKKLQDSPIKFATLTNGVNLKGKVAEIFAYYGTWIRISLEGWDDDSYAEYRNIKSGEFTKLLKNVSKFTSLNGKCHIGASIIVDKKNVYHIYELAMKLKDCGIQSLKISPCIISNSGKENDKYHMPIFHLVREQINKIKLNLEDENFEVFDAYHYLDEEFNKDYTWCPYLQILCIIGADLNVYSCQDKAYNLDEGIIGSIKDKRFKKFWFEDKNKFFKINPSIHCNHRCVADKKNKMILDYFNIDKNHIEFV